MTFSPWPAGGAAAARPVGPRLRVGRISYLNTFPVHWRLAASADEQVVEGLPKDLADALLAGELDVANVSAVAWAAHQDDLVLLAGLCVGSEDSVDSVLLLSERPVEECRTVSYTSESATSVALAKLLFPHLEEVAHAADARLVIGDRAFAARVGGEGPLQVDLGRAWRARTGLPMTFSVWTARREAVETAPDRVRAAVARLRRCVAAAKSNRPRVAQDAAERYGFPAEAIERYFEHLHYDLDAGQLAGLSEFVTRCVDAGLLPAATPADPKAFA